MGLYPACCKMPEASFFLPLFLVYLLILCVSLSPTHPLLSLLFLLCIHPFPQSLQCISEPDILTSFT